ncbi:ImmA/IrrE family metallo-endopeptidase [Ureibacillus chungkukjangi]|uniref:ImmA/IrrE family metallo-endopeptidase n=1 Tax=Ureibacillus chungkukjangi TaxID=1202712 RepID=UPI00384B1A9B
MYTTSHTEDLIKVFYTKLGILKPDQLKCEIIATKLGIDIFYWDKPSQALFMEDRAWIFLNEHLTPSQMWQDFCHELCHVLFHCGNQIYIKDSFRQYQEAKANQFMYHACVPSFMLRELNITDSSYKSIKTVSQLFNVDYSFASKRLAQYVSNKYYALFA